MAYNTRNITKDDLGKIKEINEICLTENYPLDAYVAHFEYFGPLCFVTTDNKTNDIVGYILCYIKSPKETEYHGHVTSLAVLEKHRGNKIASKLVLSSLVGMKQLLVNKSKVDKCTLNVRVGNNVAIHLYKRLGFTINQTDASYYEDGEDAYLMQRLLS